MNPSDVNRKLAEEIEPRRYQTNANLSHPPTTGANRRVREFVTTSAGGRTSHRPVDCMRSQIRRRQEMYGIKLDNPQTTNDDPQTTNDYWAHYLRVLNDSKTR